MKLNLLLQESGYTLSEPASAYAVQTKGGWSRVSADLDDASLSVSVTWKLTKQEYDFLIAFFKFETCFGKLPFEIDLIDIDACLTTHCANFSSDGPQLTSVVGLNYFVTDTLEVVPLEVDTDMDNGVIAVYGAAGGDSLRYMDLFNQIVNVNWPQT